MKYFNYHGKAKNLIKQGKLIGYYYTNDYHGITPALVLLFNDEKHPSMAIREYRWFEYEILISESEKNGNNGN